MRALLRPVKRALIRQLETPESGLRLSLRLRNGASADAPRGEPQAPWHNAVLKTRGEVDAAIDQVRRLGLPVMSDLSKNWDSLAALDVLRRHVAPSGKIYDAGAETYSMILPWLSYYGYRDLVGGNLVFDQPFQRGPIRYQFSDITQTGFQAGAYDAITCLSVIEHGVDVTAYFSEMARLLKPGGLLVTSTDYFETPTDTRGQVAFGCPIRVFDRAGIEQALEIARGFGLEPTGPLDLRSQDRVTHWTEFGLSYTFLVFTLRKR